MYIHTHTYMHMYAYNRWRKHRYHMYPYTHEHVADRQSRNSQPWYTHTCTYLIEMLEDMVGRLVNSERDGDFTPSRKLLQKTEELIMCVRARLVYCLNACVRVCESAFKYRIYVTHSLTKTGGGAQDETKSKLNYTTSCIDQSRSLVLCVCMYMHARRWKNGGTQKEMADLECICTASCLNEAGRLVFM